MKSLWGKIELRLRQNYVTGFILKRFPHYLKYFFRYYLSRKYIKGGSGIEIGPSFNPLNVSRRAEVKYVDLMDETDLSRVYRHNFRKKKYAKTDIIDDGETLKSFEDGSLDFVIANHMLEHTVNPLQTIVNFLRVLRPAGIIFLAVPNRISTFDIERPLTKIEHLTEVFETGEDKLIEEHYREVVRLVEKVPEEKIPARVAELKEDRFSIHYHTYELENFLPMIEYLIKKDYPVKLLETRYFFISTDEFIAVLQKSF